MWLESRPFMRTRGNGRWWCAAASWSSWGRAVFAPEVGTSGSSGRQESFGMPLKSPARWTSCFYRPAQMENCRPIFMVDRLLVAPSCPEGRRAGVSATATKCVSGTHSRLFAGCGWIGPPGFSSAGARVAGVGVGRCLSSWDWGVDGGPAD